jgi:hypothetical protein
MDKDQVKAFADKVYGDMASAMAVGMAYVGVKTGLFRAMVGKGHVPADEIARATGLHSRYVEEWLKGMAATGYLDYDSAQQAFRLSDERAYLVTSEGTDHFLGGLFYLAPVLLGVAPKVADAFRSGGGVPFEELGSECVTALDMINSGQYEQRFSSYWLAKLPDVVQRLQDGAVCSMSAVVRGVLALQLRRHFQSAKSFVSIPTLIPSEKPARLRRVQVCKIVFSLSQKPHVTLNGTTDLTSSPRAIAFTIFLRPTERLAKCVHCSSQKERFSL